MINIIGDSQRKSRYDPNLAEQFNREVELEEKREALKAKSKPKIQAEENNVQMPQTAESRKDYVYIPSLGLYISENRYLQDKTWNQTQEILHKEGRRMPTIPEFIEFLKYLRSDEGNKNVKNTEAILDEVYTVRSPWRSEWLDAKFEEERKGMCVANYTFDKDGEIISKTEKLETYLNEDQTPGIDLESWLENHTKQGLPKSNCKKGKFCYWYPQEGAVARFYANSDRTLLGYGYPDDHDAGLGVRYVEARSAEDRAKNSGGKSQ